MGLDIRYGRCIYFGFWWLQRFISHANGTEIIKEIIGSGGFLIYKVDLVLGEKLSVLV